MGSEVIGCIAEVRPTVRTAVAEANRRLGAALDYRIKINGRGLQYSEGGPCGHAVLCATHLSAIDSRILSASLRIHSLSDLVAR